MLERHGARPEPRLGEQAEPVCTTEQALRVSVVYDANRTVAPTWEIGVIDDVGGVRRVRIPRPLKVARLSRSPSWPPESVEDRKFSLI
jgi:hypothetical protein